MGKRGYPNGNRKFVIGGRLRLKKKKANGFKRLTSRWWNGDKIKKKNTTHYTNDHHAALMGNSQEGEYEDVHDATLGGEVYSSSFSCGGQEIGGGGKMKKRDVIFFVLEGRFVPAFMLWIGLPKMTQQKTKQNDATLPLFNLHSISTARKFRGRGAQPPNGNHAHSSCGKHAHPSCGTHTHPSRDGRVTKRGITEQGRTSRASRQSLSHASPVWTGGDLHG